ncbi:META domain-containing protein [uncultured Arcticibacterium sp.]|uniref:META domain-containing protein n=1 Tax=uncultured Arcticibacterium sp. TaxID=2173042 RepID=UPI0030FB370C
MLNKVAFVIIGLLMTQLDSCEKVDIVIKEDLAGEWVLKNVFLSDAMDSPCGWEVEKHEPLTLKVAKDGDNYSISGKSAINSYFGSLEVISFDEKSRTGKIQTSPIGSTKMAGPENLMNCETRFLSQLDTATDFAFDDNGELRIGNFRDENSHPRDGGYYLIFEKK